MNPRSLAVFLFAAILSAPALAAMPAVDDPDALTDLIDGHTATLAIEPGRADLHLEMCEAYFLLNDFERATRACTKAHELDDTLDRAFLLRGMARGRALDIGGGIEDITVYLDRHPDDSFAHTKRGVRYLWLRDLDKAKADLQTAIDLDPTNAEARDDLGVVHAMQSDYTQAIHQFIGAIFNDPTYQKAYHNLAMAYYMTGNDSEALKFVDRPWP